MTDLSELPAAQGGLYRAVWRLHFYAGILVAPFAIFLAVTGSIYLWKPQYEEFAYGHLFNVPAGAAGMSAEAQLEAARASAPPGFSAQTFQPSFAPGRAAQVIFKQPGAGQFDPGLTLFVDPHTGAAVGSIDDRTRFMRIVHDLHGTLLAGRAGQYIVELAASWALVLFVTGLYLAWPRPRFAAWGFLLPRLRAKGRVFWRDLHAVPAVWLSFATIFLLSTGLLWTQAAGGWYRTVSGLLGQATPKETSAGAHRSELTGWSPPLQAGLAEKIDALVSTPSIHAGHAAHGLEVPSLAGAGEGALPLDRVIAIAAAQRVPTPYTIALPAGPRGVYSVLSDRNQALARTFLHLDQYSGKVLADVRFGDLGVLAQFSLWGIIAHEGRLFGLLNQILGTLAAGGVVLLAVSGLVMWWKRRPAGRLAAPAGASRALPRFVICSTAGLALLLPLLGVSLVVLLLADRALLLHREK